MTRSQDRPLVKRAATLIAVVLVVWAIMLLIGGRGGVLATLRAKALLSDLEQQVAEAEAVNTAIEEENRQLREDAFAVEKVAREDLLMVRPDEVMLVVPEAADGSQAVEEQPPEPAIGP